MSLAEKLFRHRVSAQRGGLLRGFLAGSGALLLAACASRPVTHFYTLQPEPQIGSAAAAAPKFLLDVAPVRVPDQVDVPQLVLRRSGGELQLAETRQWAAPLAHELRDALAGGLSAALSSRDVHFLPRPTDIPLYRVRVDVTRFESELGVRSVLAASWVVSQDNRLTGCSGVFDEPAEGGYDALVAAHQRAVARLVAQLADAVRGMVQGQSATSQSATCPG